MKRGLGILIVLATLLSVNLASAARFSFKNLSYLVDPTTFVLIILFVIFAVLIKFSLGKFFHNKGVVTIISICVSLLAIYGISRSAFSVTNLFYKIGLTESMMSTMIPIALIIIFIIIWVKWKLPVLVLMVGGLSFLAGITEVVERSSFATIAGAIIFLIGLKLLFRRRFIDRHGMRTWYQRNDRLSAKAEKIGRDVGYSGAAIVGGVSGLFKGKKRGGGSSGGSSLYKPGMRRGGTTSHKRFNPKTGKMGRVHPGSFVGKGAVGRYARRFGSAAAKLRFKVPGKK